MNLGANAHAFYCALSDAHAGPDLGQGQLYDY